MNTGEMISALAAVCSAAVTCLGLPLALVGLFYTVRQLQAAQRTAKGDFLLRLDEAFQRHQEVHRRLRPGGDWADSGQGPESVEEWIAVEQYMGLFERIKTMIDDGIVDLATIDRLYGYRVLNIVANDQIRQAKLEYAAEDWSDFLSLLQAIKTRRG
ncbi:MAG: hypothetical protein KIT87_04825 [Anaerolineae bacterium]|nr:hypothetical protein [Anaerolineae bacterium]